MPTSVRSARQRMALIAHKKVLTSMLFSCTMLCIIGSAAPYWVVFSGEDVSRTFFWTDFHSGLWKTCIKLQGFSSYLCQTYDMENHFSDYFQDARDYSLVCDFLGVSSVTLAFIMILYRQDINTFYVSVIGFIAGVFGTIALSTFVKQYEKDSSIIAWNTTTYAELTHIGWAFVVFFVGVMSLTFISALGIVVSPDNLLISHLYVYIPSTNIATAQLEKVSHINKSRNPVSAGVELCHL